MCAFSFDDYVKLVRADQISFRTIGKWRLAIARELGGWALLNHTAENILKHLVRGVNTRDLLREYNEEHVRDCLSALQWGGLLRYKHDFDIPKTTNKTRDDTAILVLKVTRACNLRCRYCYAATDNCTAMSSHTAFLAVKKTLQHFAGLVTVIFHGGEPLLERAVFEDVVDRIGCTFPDSLCRVRFVLQVNGTMMNSKIAQSLVSRKILAVVSSDGYEDSQNSFRVDTHGKAVTRRTLCGLRCLLREGVPTSVSVVVSRANVSSLPDIARFFIAEGVLSIGFVMYAPLGKTSDLRPEVEVFPDELFQAMVRVTDLVIAHNKLSQTPVRVDEIALMAENLLFRGQSRLCTFRAPCGAGTNHVAVDTNGDVYPCDNLIGYPSLRQGNMLTSDLEQILSNHQITDLINQTPDNMEPCRTCDWKRFCNAGCPAHAFAFFGTFRHRSFYCEYYQRMFEYILTLVSNGVSPSYLIGSRNLQMGVHS